MSSNKPCQININHAQTVVHDEGNTLLESLEKHGVPVQYHCREGFCGACRTTLESGEVEYTIAPLAYIDDDEILPCCCRPISDITVKID